LCFPAKNNFSFILNFEEMHNFDIRTHFILLLQIIY
jgi:hypothetical protein